MYTDTLLFKFLAVLYLVAISQACQPQVCRKRRATVEDGTVKMLVTGCRLEAPPWLRQVAYCMEYPTIKIAINIKDWYRDNYSNCENKGCDKYHKGDPQKADIDNCVDCWKKLVTSNRTLKETFEEGVWNKTKIEDCLESYVKPYLDKGLPTFNSESRFKHTIELKDIRPAEYWWSITVRLPCRPKVFWYWNAYCANSFGRNVSDSDYVLVQNKIMNKKKLGFYVDFSDTCSFEPEDIKIIWDESIPVMARPQISQFPSKVPKPEEDVTIFFDSDASERLKKIDRKLTTAERDEMNGSNLIKLKKNAVKRRKKRSIASSQIGVEFPCRVKSFRVARAGIKGYSVYERNGKYLIDIKGKVNKTKFQFKIHFGQKQTGCHFGSSDVVFVQDPPAYWFTQKKGPQCSTCVNARNDLDCLHMGYKKVCAEGEYCQTEVRQITKELKLITKACKQRIACERESFPRLRSQCHPDKAGSVCRCCCGTNMCNAGQNPCSL